MKIDRWKQNIDLKLVLSKIDDDYDLIDKLGGGGYSNVYKIYHKLMKKEFALKIMDADYITKGMHQYSEDEENIQYLTGVKARFINEAKVCQSVKHPNIVAVKDVGVVTDEQRGIEIPYLIMEHIEGETLKRELRDRSTIDMNRVFQISKNILSALDAIHKKGIIYRDIKTSNIMIKRESDEAVLIDFGLAKDLLNWAKLTAPGMSLGTSHYMSPEQFDDISRLNRTSDVYSFGVVLYEMVTGEVPFDGQRSEIMLGHIKKDVPNILDMNPEAPPALQKIIEKAMAKNPKDRYQNAAEFLGALNALDIGEEKSKPKDTRIIPGPSEELFEIGRFFNTAGPVNSKDHYYIDSLDRFDLKHILSLIAQKKYFVLHAPRQTGKTSYMLALMDHLNKTGQYKCLYVNVEMAQAARENVKAGIKTILDVLATKANDYLEDPYINNNRKRIFDESGELSALYQTLKQWTKDSSVPIVLLIDEIDSLVGDTLISVLRQLRSGYTDRPGLFPQSIILCGVRDVRDYRIHSDKEKAVITGGSAFNIKAESLRMGSFSREEIKTLYDQHTKDTGQKFKPDVFPLLWDLTEGQPWLVNALGYEICFRMKEGLDRKRAITGAMIEQAKENLILRRETHLDQLADKLSEPRIRRVLEPILSGFGDVEKIPTDDIDYAVDLGLIKKERQIKISNRIYKEVIPRELTYSAQLTIYQEALWYEDEDGSLDMDKLLTAFQDFFRKHFESWVDGFDYAEAGPQLLLQAFLQRIVNSHGRVEREYGLGRQRTDLLILWPFKKKSVQQVVLELKLRHLHSSLETVMDEGSRQLLEYMDKCGTKEGYLLIFDRNPEVKWEDKIFKKENTVDGVKVKIFGM